MTMTSYDNPVSFFTGEDDYKNTRLYSKWLGDESIKVSGKEYESISSIVDSNISPWTKEIPIDGTDGF